ncbi:hypothetical protein BD408DRAFT_421901 [Parasitella parasitica]|nr:hypothetical protein BD408DRAFT_421901 [Parasitella parasitica]
MFFAQDIYQIVWIQDIVYLSSLDFAVYFAKVMAKRVLFHGLLVLIIMSFHLSGIEHCHFRLIIIKCKFQF